MNTENLPELVKIQDADKIRYILDEGVRAVGDEGSFRVTQEEFDEVFEKSDDIVRALDSKAPSDEDYFENLIRRVEDYANQIPYRSQEDVLNQSVRLSESVNTNRTLDVNAAGLIYTASLLSNQRTLENGEKVSQRYLSDVLGVSANSLRESYEDIMENQSW